MKAIFFKIIPLLLLSVLIMCACNGEQTETPTTPENGQNVTFSEPAVELSVFESKKLDFETDYHGEIAFSSDNDQVVRTSGDYIVGVSAGTATVSALINGKTVAQITAYVTDVGVVPFLTTAEDTIGLFVGSSYQILPDVSYNGVLQQASFSFESTDGSVAEVNDAGEITGKKKGSAEIVITAEFNGFSGKDHDFLRKTLQVNVSESVIVQLRASITELSNHAQTIEGKEYKNEAILSGSIYEDGKAVDLVGNVKFVTTNENVVSFSGNKLVARGLGTCQVYAEYARADGVYTSNKLDITVDLPLIHVSGKPLDIDLSEPTLDINRAFLVSEDETVVKIYDIQDNKEIYKNEALIDYRALGERQWIVYTDSFRYELNVICCSKIVRTALDLRRLINYASNVSRGTNGVVSYEGYYILDADIDMEKQPFIKNVSPDFGATSGSGTGFIGVFDGRGHTVYNALVSADNGGLFGTLNKNSVVKNVCFKDAEVSGRSGLISSYCAGTISNCCIEGTITGPSAVASAQKALLSRVILQSAVIDHCVVVYQNPEDAVKFASAIGTLSGAKEINFDSVYVVGTVDKVIGTDAEEVYNRFATAYNGQYSLYSEMKANADISSFEVFWSFYSEGISFINKTK